MEKGLSSVFMQLSVSGVRVSTRHQAIVREVWADKKKLYWPIFSKWNIGLVSSAIWKNGTVHRTMASEYGLRVYPVNGKRVR